MKCFTSEIGILGYACRLPGAASPGAFWDLLEDRRTAISEIGSDRWSPDVLLNPNVSGRGTTYTAAAGLLPDIYDFDPSLFSISPREAAQMDPQQRLVLQVVWEAMEHAGLTADRLRGSRSGVFIGASSLDHAQMNAGDPAALDVQFMTGNTLSVLSNRVAHFLDIQGPSCTFDTACASSLFALHYASEALRTGEIDLAIVGGVNALLSPIPFIGFSRAGMLSRAGVCRAFDANADGYVRSEGAVVFVIGRADGARRNGDRIRSVVCATAVSTSGHTPALSIPSESAQADVMRRAMEAGGLSPDDFAFVEAHGTGTQVGDVIEANAIGTTIGAGRSSPLPVGSAKTNIGHLEPVSGLVGLLKAQLSLEHGVYPASLNLETPNPNIAFDELNIRIATEPVTLPSDKRPWLAGVNSFGFGGANAHAVLREAGGADNPSTPNRRRRKHSVLILSAASTKSLKKLACEWSERLAASHPSELAPLVNSAAYRRTRLPYSLAVGGSDQIELAEALADYSRDARSDKWREGYYPQGSAGTIAFVFSGNGSQWVGMGRKAFAGDVAFRRSFKKVSATILDFGGPDLVASLSDPELQDRLKRASVAQPFLFAIQFAIVNALASRGVRPHLVAGHSVGEVAAAWCAGILTLEDAAQLTVRRSLRQEPLYQTGRLVAALGGIEELRKLIADLGRSNLCIAADNSPRSVTISGDIEAVQEFIQRAREARIAYRQLPGEYPFHSPLMETIRDALVSDLAEIRPSSGSVRFVSSTTGSLIDGKQLDAEYWWKTAREPVRFRDTISELARNGAEVFVEISPKTVLRNYLSDTLYESDLRARIVPTQEGRSSRDGNFQLIAAEIAINGGKIDERRLFGSRLPMTADLPRYPWDNRPYRIDTTSDAINVNRNSSPHPLLGWRAVEGEGAWHLSLDLERDAWLSDHRVDGTVVVPAAVLLELFLAAITESATTVDRELCGLEILRPIVLGDRGAVDLRVTSELDETLLMIESRPRLGADGWALNARASVRKASVQGGRAQASASPGGSAQQCPGNELYLALKTVGLDYGKAFRLVERISLVEGEALVELNPPSALAGHDCGLNPTSVDAAFHGLLPLIAKRPGAEGARDVAYVPTRIEGVRLLAPGRMVARARIKLLSLSGRHAQVKIRLFDAEGELVAELDGVGFTAMPLLARRDPASGLWRQRWLRLRDSDAKEAQVPASWMEPRLRLRAIGLVQDRAPEPDAGALLVDAACRRIVWDACLDHVGPGGRFDFNVLDQFPEITRSLFRRGLQALVEDGAFDPEVLRFADTAPVPPWAELVCALVREAPERAVELGALLKLRRVFAGEEVAAFTDFELNPASATQWSALCTAAKDLLAEVPPHASVDLLVLGGAPDDVVEAISGFGCVGRLVCVPPDSARLRPITVHAKAVRVPSDEALRAGPFDLVLCANLPKRVSLEELGAAMALGGLLLAFERRRDLYPDLTAACRADAETLPHVSDGSAVVASRLIDAGFVAVQRMPMAATAVEGEVFAARAPGRLGDLDSFVAAAAKSSDGSALLHVASDCDGPGLVAARLLVATLEQSRGSVQLQTGDPQETGLAGEPAEIIYLAGMYAECDETSDAVDRLEAVRGLLSTRGLARIWLVTRGGRPAAADHPMPEAMRRPADAALWGFGRVLRNERPELDVRLVDLSPGETPEALVASLAKIIAEPGETREIAVAAGGNYSLRVEAAPDIAGCAATAGISGADIALQLHCPRRGSLDGIGWRLTARRAPARNEVEIEVRATGLNYRDVMFAMNMLPSDVLEGGFSGATLGMECAGIVVRAGLETEFRPGDRVMAFAASALATHVTVSQQAVMRIPPQFNFVDAAALPVVFATAWYALAEVATLKPGETVLIHGGAGGVGLAALQVARHLGARVIATAGTPEKRSLLELLGADHVFDSRNLGFGDAIMTVTGGQGVDVALNSLSGEAMERTLECLRPFGRFVELGKRDFVQNTRVGLRPLRHNISYFAVDLDQLLDQRPDKARALLDALQSQFEAGTLVAPPYRLFSSDQAGQAFRLMQRSGHIGKILITPPKLPERKPTAAGVSIRPDGAYLVAGGLTGFGLKTAEWLAAKGAGNLWLASRSGVAVGDAAAAIEALKARGVRVHSCATDFSDMTQVEELIARIQRDGGEVRGVVHSAMVIDDGLFETLSTDRMERVMRPKIAGLRHMDRATRRCDLDFFVAYSSVAGLVGNPGQGAYAAANAFMESLIADRRAEGLCGLAMAFGPLSDVGHLSRDVTTREILKRRLGGGMMVADEALRMLDLALAAGDACDPVIFAAPLQWGRLARDLPVVASPLFERVERSDAEGLTEKSGATLAALIAGLDEKPATVLLIKHFRGEVARILQQEEGEIDPDRPLTELGFDSLLAVELKLAFEEKFGATLNTLSLSEGVTLREIARRFVLETNAPVVDEVGVADAMAAELAVRHVAGGWVDPEFAKTVVAKSTKVQKVVQ